MSKYHFFIVTIVISIVLSGCGVTASIGDPDEIPAVPVKELANEFEKGFYQEVEAESGKVKNFDTKEQWVQHMSEIMDQDLAQYYADDFYYEEEGQLYLHSRGGPAMLIPDKPYEMKNISEKKAQVIQRNENELFGEYELTVTYEYKDGRWIIQEHNFSTAANSEGPLPPKEAEKIISARAEEVLNLIANQDMEALIEYIHPDKGLRFSPYSYVDDMDSVIFMPSDFESFLAYPSEYYWGSYDGTGEPISLTPADYYDRFIYDRDYRKAHQTSYNEQLFSGNMINNARDVYPDSIIVEYHFEGFEAKYEGMDWRSLRLVFEEYDDEWLLVGIIHDEWTI